MFRKKMIFAGAAVVMTFSLSVFPAFAHGHHGGHHGNRTMQTVPDSNYNTGAAGNTDTNAGADLSAETDAADTAAVPGAYPICNFEGCAITGHHLHDGSYYCGYHHESGYCDGSCIGSYPAAGTSSAPGTTYPVCTYEGCIEAGRHLHDGSYYCGYHHAGGYCDGSCIGSYPAVSDSPAADNSSSGSLPAVSGYGYGRKYGCHRSYAKKLFYCH